LERAVPWTDRQDDFELVFFFFEVFFFEEVFLFEEAVVREVFFLDDAFFFEVAFLREVFLVVVFLLDEVFLDGTLAPSRRACERPIATACFRLLTFLPDLPLLKVPRFRSRIACSTFFDAFLPYFRAMSETPG
jgi:hypothetical protein